MLSEIEQNLKILGITSFSQFKEGDITYWWQKKYMQISNKKLSKNKISDQLIELNLSKEFLDGIKYETIKDVFDKWIESVFDIKSKTLKYKDDYVSEVEIQQLNDQNIPVYSCKLRKAFPINISTIDLGNTNENTISRVTITFAYDDWVETSSAGSAIAAKIGNEIFNRFF